jgi:hypothetical protein
MTGRIPLSFVAALLAALALGFAAGRLVFVSSLQNAPVTVREDTRPSIPVLTLDGVEGGAIVGTLQGEARIIADGEAVAVAEGPVRIPLSRLPQVVTVQVPAGMAFVASKNGTKYYAVESAAGAKIVPANRVYFRTGEEAEAAGYAK